MHHPNAFDKSLYLSNKTGVRDEHLNPNSAFEAGTSYTIFWASAVIFFFTLRDPNTPLTFFPPVALTIGYQEQ
jgi:hypothetical protein